MIAVQPLCHLCDRWACVQVDGVVKLCLPCWREVHLSCYPSAWQPQHDAVAPRRNLAWARGATTVLGKQ